MIGSGLIRRAASAMGFAPVQQVTALAVRSSALERRSRELYGQVIDIQKTSTELSHHAASLETRNRMLKSALVELTGGSGVPMTMGRFDYEQNRALQGKARWVTYDQMENDPAVSEMLELDLLALQGAEWGVRPASNAPIDIRAAQLVEANLLRKSSKAFGRRYWSQTSFRAQRLPEILRMRAHGFAMFKKSTREVDGMIVYDRIQYLEPQTVDPYEGWDLAGDDDPNFAPDEIRLIKRTYRDAQDQVRYGKPLEPKDIALYPWKLIGARYEGRPATRAMYSAWFRKDFVLKMAIIWAQKVGCPAPVGFYPFGWTDSKQLADFRLFIEQLRGTSPTDAMGMFPQDANGNSPEIKYVGSDTGEVDRMGALVEQQNAEISRAGLKKSRMLGETQSGSRALAEPLSRSETTAAQAIAMIICEFENHGVANLKGLVQELVDWNFQVEAYPELVCSKIDPYEGLQNIDQIYQGIEKGVIPNCRAVGKHVVSLFGIPGITDKDFDEADRKREEAQRAIAGEKAKGQDGEPGSGSNDGEPPAAGDDEESDTSGLSAAAMVNCPPADMLDPLGSVRYGAVLLLRASYAAERAMLGNANLPDGLLTQFQKWPLETVQLDRILATQNSIDPQTVEKYRQNGSVADEYPLAGKVRGWYVLQDGHHRVVAALANGETAIVMRVLDVGRYDTTVLSSSSLTSYLAANDVRQAIAPWLAPSDVQKTRTMRRGPNKLEATFLNLAAIQRSFDQGEQSALGDLRKARAMMIADIVRRVQSGRLNARSLTTQRASNPNRGNDLKAQLAASLGAVAKDGQAHVRGELDRMRNSGAVAA